MKLENIIQKGIITSALLLGLAGCGDKITNNPYYGNDVETTDVLVEETNTSVDAGIEVGYDASVDTNDVEKVTEVETITTTVSFSDNYQCGEFENFPEEFQTDGIFNGYIVVGENSSTDGTLAAIDISNSMKYNDNGVEKKVQVINASKLDSEIADVSTQNLISVGNPCVNSVTAELLGNPTDCTQGFYPGKAKIISLQHKDTGYLALIVAGYSGADTRLAGRVIEHRYKDIQKIGGCVLNIQGPNYSNATITK